MRARIFHLCLTLLTLAACSSDPAQPDGPRVADAPVPDATSPDATPDGTLDATPDAEPDARVDGAGPMGCMAQTELVENVAPYHFRDILTDGTHIITVETMTDGDVTLGSRVVVRDFLASTGTVIHSTDSAQSASAVGSWIYYIDHADQSIWRWQDGQAPEQLISGLSNLVRVTANSTHIYWNSTNNTIDRRAIAGGPIEPVAPFVDTLYLHANDTDLFAGSFGSSGILWQYPISGAPPVNVWQETSGGFAVGMIEAGGILYWADFFHSVWRRDLATGVNTEIASATIPLTRPIGVAIRGNYIYVVDYGGAQGSGVYRALKAGSGGNLVKITPEGAEQGPAIIGSYLHWGEYDKLWRCNLQP